MELSEQLAGMVAPHSPLEAAVRRMLEAWTPYKGERGGTGWQNESGRVAYVKDMPGSGGSRDLFGEPLKPEPGKPDEIKSLGGRQQSLFAKRGLPGQMSLFADAGVPDDLVGKPAEIVTDSAKIGDTPANTPVEQGPGGSQSTVEASMNLNSIKSVMANGKPLEESSNEINRLTQGMTDEQAVEIAGQLGLPNVTGVWALKNAVLAQSEEVFARGEAEKWGLVGQPKKRVAGQNLPVASPNAIRYRTMDGLKQQLKAKFVTRAPAAGEAIATIERPQRANQFIEYRPGDVITGRGGLRFVVQAAKDGYTRSGEGWKRWEQTLVLRLATQDDIDAVASQQAASDANGKRLMDSMMAS